MRGLRPPALDVAERGGLYALIGHVHNCHPWDWREGLGLADDVPAAVTKPAVTKPAVTKSGRKPGMIGLGKLPACNPTFIRSGMAWRDPRPLFGALANQAIEER